MKNQPPVGSLLYIRVKCYGDAAIYVAYEMCDITNECDNANDERSGQVIG